MFPTMKMDESLLSSLLLLNNALNKVGETYTRNSIGFTGYASIRSAVLDDMPCIILNIVIERPEKKYLIKKLPATAPKGRFDFEIIHPRSYQVAGIVEMIKKMYAVK